MHTPLFSQGYEQQGLWPPEIIVTSRVENSFFYFSQFDLVCTGNRFSSQFFIKDKELILQLY